MSDAPLPCVINLDAAFSRIAAPWQPHLAGEVNTACVKLARFAGEFPWHSHEFEDELFLVVRGEIILRFRGGERLVRAGEMIIVPRGTEHQPVAHEEALVLLFEPQSTLNTGNVQCELTLHELPGI